ncbi:hypothetical protein [Maribacter litoralis]|uniref:hypothetical protein n=1 Tax=Maribacter litoralis TaxID=2059726 RepID=UPI003F5CE212
MEGIAAKNLGVRKCVQMWGKLILGNFLKWGWCFKVLLKLSKKKFCKIFYCVIVSYNYMIGKQIRMD